MWESMNSLPDCKMIEIRTVSGRELKALFTDGRWTISVLEKEPWSPTDDRPVMWRHLS